MLRQLVSFTSQPTLIFESDPHSSLIIESGIHSSLYPNFHHKIIFQSQIFIKHRILERSAMNKMWILFLSGQQARVSTDTESSLMLISTRLESCNF